MRFIFNFFFFGLLFFLIYIFLPDTFHTLVSWATSAYEFIRGFVQELTQKYHTSITPEAGEAAKAILFLILPRKF